MLIVKELHHKVSVAAGISEKSQEQLESFVDVSMIKMNRKVNKVLQLFQDTLLYSSKTYYQEEIYKRDKANKALQDRVTQLERKFKLTHEQKKIQAQMAGRLMQNVDEIESSSEQLDEVARDAYNDAE